MEIEKFDIAGLLLIKPRIFGDERGYFMESFRLDKMRQHGVVEEFVQDNQSMSAKGILRGLHFQAPPYAQGKLVQVIKGSVLDVVVDIRKSSPTYGQHKSGELNENNKHQFWVPPGFAHGFVTLEDNSIFCYKCTDYYNKESEGSLRWDSPSLGINWGVENPTLSEKDQAAPIFENLESPFE